MLVLSRKRGESLIIGEGIRVTITRIAGNRVALGIDAPPEVPVLRGELERRDQQPTQTKEPRELLGNGI